MKAFSPLLSLTLIATLVAAPALYSSQASSSCALSSSSSSSARASSASSSSTQTSTALQEGVDNSQRASETHTSHPQSRSWFSFIYSFSSWLMPENNTSIHQGATTVPASDSYSSASSGPSASVDSTAEAISRETKLKKAAIYPTLVALISDYDNTTLSAEELFELGTRYQTGICAKKNEKLAAELYQLTADEGYAPAQCRLAGCYLNNEGVPTNLTQEQRLTKAIELHALAANQGYAIGQLGLALCYCSDEGVPANLTPEQRLTEITRLVTLAANQGYAEAQFCLATCYYNNKNVPANLTQKQRLIKAVELYTLAANQNHVEAQYCLATCYYNNEGVPANLTPEKRFTESVLLFTLAANQGYAKAQYNLAYCYEKGIGIKQDLTKALKLYRLAAEQGHRRAQSTICKAFQKGLLPKTEEFQKLADSCRTQLGWKLGSEQAAREAIEEETIALHNKIPLYCQGEPCVICFKEFAPLQQITILPCYHTFCPGCIRGWLDAGHESCPTCRKRATERFTALVMKKEAKSESKESKE